MSPQPSGPQQPGSGDGPGGNGPQPGSSQGKSSNSGCGTVFVIVAAVLLVLLLVVALGGGSCTGANVPASTVERTALPAGSVNETGYFTDEDGDWIHDPAKLERGLRHFYEETGVQPYVYILPNGSVRSYQELQSIAQEKYDELFTDQAHFVLVFCDDGNGRFNAAYWAGAMTGSVLDDEAINIFKAYLSQNYDDMSLDGRGDLLRRLCRHGRPYHDGDAFAAADHRGVRGGDNSGRRRVPHRAQPPSGAAARGRAHAGDSEHAAGVARRRRAGGFGKEVRAGRRFGRAAGAADEAAALGDAAVFNPAFGPDRRLTWESSIASPPS